MDYKKLLNIVCCLTVSGISNIAFADLFSSNHDNTKTFHIQALYLQPDSNNLKYAVFVEGNQPYSQGWHNQSIDPGYSPAFDIGLNYAIRDTEYDVSVDWLYANTSDSDFKQASQNTDVATVQFVAPPYDVGPGVFGIKRADSTVDYNFNNIGLDVGRRFEYGPHVKGRILAGFTILSLNQDLTTTFSDYAGSPELPGQAYALPADPNFYVKSENTSDYFGVGPNLGLDIQYIADNGWGVFGQFLGMLTAGSIGANDDFTSSSSRLIDLGLSPSRQEITTPNATQVVPGLDSSVGVSYNHMWHDVNFAISLGYRFAYYFNAISTISPDTLVQAGDDATIPEFATGTVAINSTTSSNSPFSLQGPYLDVTMSI